MALDIEGVKYVADLSQWTPNVKKVIDDTDDASKSVSGMASTFNDKLQIVENSIGAVTAAYLVFDREISRGEGIVQTRALFNAMAGSAQNAKRGEEELRQATRGLVDDETALAGASKLMSLHLADNVDQAAQIVGLGTQLGRVFLHDATGGINAFDTALANTSARGLQQLGISYDEVAAKQKLLIQQGMSTRDAFRQALIEVATDVRDKLGDSVIMAGSQFDRAKRNVSEFFDTVAEAAATGYNNLSDFIDEWQKVDQATRNSTMANNPGLAAALGLISGVATGGVGSAALAAGLPAPPSGQIANRGTTSSQFAGPNTGAPQTYSYTYNPAIIHQANVALQQQISLDYRREQNQRRIAEHYQQQTTEMQRQGELTREQERAAQTVNQITGEGAMSMTYSMNQIQSLMAAHPTSLFSDKDAYQAQSLANNLKNQADYVQQMHELYPTMVSDHLVASTRAMADNAQSMADAAKQGAQAFDSMNLQQLFGQTSGGVAGQIVGNIEQFLQSQGVATDQLQQISNQMELTTGQQTTTSQFYQSVILPALAAIAKDNAAAAGTMAKNLQDYIQQQTLAGQQITQAGLLNAAGLGYGPTSQSRQISVQAGMTATQAANFNGISVQQLIVTTGAMNANTIPVGTFSMQTSGGTGVAPVQGPGTALGGGPGVLAQQMLGDQQPILDASQSIQTAAATAQTAVDSSTQKQISDMTTLNQTGQEQLTGPTGLTTWWDQFKTVVQNVYNTINPLISNLAQGMSQMNSSMKSVQSGAAGTATPNPVTGHGFASGGRISDRALVGEHGPELFTPSRAGYIVNSANTESILSALAGVLSGGVNHVQNNQRSATVNQYVTVQGNAQAASAMMNVGDALRGFA